MPTVLRYCFPLCFVLLFGSCSIQDHLAPAPSNQCRITLRLDDLDTYLIGPNETITIGQRVTGLQTDFFVRDILDIDDRKYAIGWKDDVLRVGAEQSNTSYEYDSEGRIKKTVTRIKRPTADLTREYTYTSPTQLDVKRTDDYFHYPVPPSDQATYTLNTQGMVVDPNVTFDAEGYSTRIGPNYYAISNGNVVRAEEGSNVTIYDYDITKPNPVPDPVPFFRKSDRNLRIGMREENNPAKFTLKYINGPDGQVKYQIRLIEIPDDPRIRILVNGFEWSCPK